MYSTIHIDWAIIANGINFVSLSPEYFFVLNVFQGRLGPQNESLCEDAIHIKWKIFLNSIRERQTSHF